LLTGRLGAERLSAEREATREIIVSCAGLPLALSIFAARAAAQPCFPLAVLAAELLRPRSPAESHPQDPDTDIRVVFSWSYRCLPDHAARVFRLLGIHPGPDIDVAAAAALANAGTAATQAALGELAAAHLLTEHAPGRFTCHDLLRVYARELAHELDSERGCRAARHRIYNYYLHTAFAAAMRLNPVRDPIALEPPPHGVSPGRFTSYHQALGWFRDEHQALLTSIDLARLDQQDSCAWQLAWTIADYLDRRGHWHDWAATHLTALDAARRLADKPGEAHALSGIGRACDRLGRYDDAHEHLQGALRLYQDLGDRAGEAQAQLNLAGLCERQGRYAESLVHAQQALPLFQDADSQAGRANTLNVIGWCRARLGDYTQALTYCRQALAVHQQIGDRLGAANTLDSLGYAHHNLGDHQAANAAYRDALRLYRDLGDRYYEAVVLTHIGDNEHAAGDAEAARGAWLRALSILDPLDRADTDQVATRCDCPDAALVRAKLRESGVASPELLLGSGPDPRGGG
jgi:tetratricopeptide (TPR) repeat protein